VALSRWVLDRATRLLPVRGGGTALLGGSPLSLLRLTPAGAALVRRAERGEPIAVESLSEPAQGLLDRLVDSGAIVPVCSPEDGPSPGEVAVVIPVFDRPDGLATTLRSLARVSPDVAEVVVVDDASTDPDPVREVVAGTAAMTGAPPVSPRVTTPASDVDGRVSPTRARAPGWPWHIQLVRRPVNGGAGAARNTGLAAAQSPFMAFVDAGCEVRPGWLEALLPHFADERVALVAPRVRGREAGPHTRTGAASWAGESRTAVARYEAVRSALDLGADPAPVRPRSRVPYVPSTTFVGRATHLHEAGGFDEELKVGEDVDLVWRLHEAGHRVRYEPAAEVGHDHPTRLGPWLRRRVDYGTSAAPLAARHTGMLAPLGVSPWSAAVWALTAAGHPVAGATIAGGTAVALGRRLRDRGLVHPIAEAARLTARGHVGAGRLIARSLTRAWLPITAATMVLSGRGRRVALAAAVVPALVDWWTLRPALDPARFVALATADDIAYGAGVWLGAARTGTWEPVTPALTPWRP
jgi:mycofactocin system glycosyltransferase